MRKIRISKLDQIRVGTPRCVISGDRTIAVVRTEEGVYALDDNCPHRGGPLSEGDLIDGQLVCPWHFWAFDLQTGMHEASGGKFRVRTFETEISDGTVYVVVPEGEDGESETAQTCRPEE